MPRYDDSLRQLVANCIEDGGSTADIVDRLQVSERLVQRYRKNILTFGTHKPPLISLSHRPKSIDPVARDALQELLDTNGTLMLDEIQDWLVEEFGIECHLSTISRCLKEMRVTHKKTERVVEQQDAELRSQWLWKTAVWYKPNQLVFVDESAASERTKDRRWGWSMKGIPCRVKQSSLRSNRWSVLPAIGVNGYLDYEVFHGSFNSERFENFIQRLLQKMTAFSGPRSVLVMDNVSAHHSPWVRELCHEAGVILEYLPPYLPDLSPIEESFSALKAWMRRNRSLSEPLLPAFDIYLHLAVAQCNFRESARGFFRNAGIAVTDDDVDVEYDELNSV